MSKRVSLIFRDRLAFEGQLLIDIDIAAIFENINETFSSEILAKQTVLNQTEQNVRHATRSLADKRQQIHRSQIALTELEQIGRKSENIRRVLPTLESQDWTGRSDSQPVGPAFRPIPKHVEQPTVTSVSSGTEIGLPGVGEPNAVVTLRRMLEWEKRAAQMLEQRIQSLEGEGLEKELKYRRLVALCTKVPVEKVDGVSQLCIAKVSNECS